MRRLLCLLALACLAVSPALAQTLVASAATRIVHQRVEEALKQGGKLTPEVLLPHRQHSLAAAAAYSDRAPASAVKNIHIAASGAHKNSAPVAAASAAHTQGLADESDVGVAGKELHINWAVRQVGSMTLETDDEEYAEYPPAYYENEAGTLLRRFANQRLVQKQPAAGHTEVEYVQVIHPGGQQEQQMQEGHHGQPRMSQAEHEGPHSRQQESDSATGPSGEEEELIKRLTQVDWQAVFDAAQREAAAEEAALDEKRAAEADARKSELKRRIEQATAERRQADAERQQAEQERQRALHELQKAAAVREDAESVKQRLEEDRELAAQELQKAGQVTRRAAAEQQQAEAVKRRAAEEAEELKDRYLQDARQKAEQQLQEAEAVKHRAAQEAKELKDRFVADVKQKAAEERQKAEAVQRKAAAEAEELKDRVVQDARQKAAQELREAEAVKRRATEEAEELKDRTVAGARQKAAQELQEAEAVKRKATQEAQELKERVVEDRQKAAHERQQAEAVRQRAEAERRQQQQHAAAAETEHRKAAAAEEAKKKAKPAETRPGKEYFEHDESEYSDDAEPSHRKKVLVQEKARSPLRYFPGGGIYSFTSELTCITDNEYYEKLAFKTFPMITPRMTKVTVGLCEWTVAEVAPTQVNKNVFLLGNAWATCNFLPIAGKECSQPMIGGLTLSVQALMYQFAQPKGIREAEPGELDEEPAKKPSTSAEAKVAIAAAGPAKVAVAAAEPAKKSDKKAAGAADAPQAPAAANVTASVQGVKAKSKSKGKGKKGAYLMDVELDNVFLGLITGAFGPKKAHKYKHGAVQFAYGPPPDADGKSYAVQTRLLPTHLGGPSLEDLQEGMVQLVPGTYQIVFEDDDY